MSARLRGPLLALASVALLLDPACKCGAAGVRSRAPQIDVQPAALVFTPLPAGQSEVSIVQVRNIGNADLHFASDPAIAEPTGQSDYSVNTAPLDHDCTGGKRDEASRRTLLPGDCARVVVRYAPPSLNAATGTLTLASDDPDHPMLAVPLSLGDPARIQVCTVKADGSAGPCDAADGTPPTLNFGLVAKGQSAHAIVRIKNTGKGTLQAITVPVTFGPTHGDYVHSASTPATLAPDATADITVQFTPLGGGARTAWLEIDSSDPARPALKVPLSGNGEGPALTADLDPLEFGQVPVGGHVDKILTLTSTGTVAVQLQALSFDILSSSAFSNTAAFPAPQTLAPGAKVTVALRFRPEDKGAIAGALLVPNDGDPNAFVTLHGTSVETPACRLSASVATLEFGHVVRGQSTQKPLNVANRGTLPCSLSAVKITAGSSYFSVINPPGSPVVLKPGDSHPVTLQYAPPANDTNASDSGSVELDSDDPNTPQLMVALRGEQAAEAVCTLVINPQPSTDINHGILQPTRVLQFGNVTVNHPKTVSVQLTNTGSAVCSISSLTLVTTFGGATTGVVCNTVSTPHDCGGFSVDGVQPSSIPQGTTASINVTFTPTNDTQVPFGPAVFMTIETNAANLVDPLGATPGECGQALNSNAGCALVGMSGQGDYSNLQVLPNDLDFGLVTLGCRAQQENVTLYNTGNASPINIKSILLDPTTAPFFISAPPTPFVIPPNGKKVIQVTYKPTQAAPETGTLKIASDASNATSNNPYETVSLRGQGTTDKHQADTFTQSTVPLVDLLFVVDDSGSFDFYQKQIAQQANAFVSAALKNNVDFHFGVSANDVKQTDSDNSSSYPNTPIYVGGLFGQPGVVSNSTPNTADAFAKNIRMGTSGTAQREAGLELAWNVLTGPASTKPPPMGSMGFLRDAARLVIIDVQDDDDQSNNPTAFFIDFFKNLKGKYNAGLVSFNAIGDFDTQTNLPTTDCVGNGEPAGQRYYEVAQGTGGQTWSICNNPDWGAIANQLALGAFSGRKQFPLTRVADPATVVVTLNGAAQASPGDYAFDQPSNSVIFKLVPAAGATIVVNYDALCF